MKIIPASLLIDLLDTIESDPRLVDTDPDTVFVSLDRFMPVTCGIQVLEKCSIGKFNYRGEIDSDDYI